MLLGPSFYYRFVQVYKPIIFYILESIKCSLNHQRPGNDYQLAGQQNTLPEHSSNHAWLPEHTHSAPKGHQSTRGHLWFFLPLAISLGTGESPFLVALEHLPSHHPSMKSHPSNIGDSGWAFSDSSPEVSGRFFIRVSGCVKWFY